MNSKNAFSIAEIIVSMIIMSMLTYFTIVNKMFDNRINNINEGYKQLSGFISTALLDSTVGYPNSLGGDCSLGVDYIDISAYRAKECSELNNFTIKGQFSTQVEQKDSSKNYLSGILKNLVKDGGKVYFHNDNNNTDQFYMFVDFSETNAETQKNKDKDAYFIEEVLKAKLSKDFSTLIIGIQDKATSLDSDEDGTNIDGMFKVHFRN